MREAAPVQLPAGGGWSAGAKLLAFVGVAACLLLLASPLTWMRDALVATRSTDQAAPESQAPAPDESTMADAAEADEEMPADAVDSPSSHPFEMKANPAATAPSREQDLALLPQPEPGDVRRLRYDSGPAAGAGAAPSRAKYPASGPLPETDRYSAGLGDARGGGEAAAPASAYSAANNPTPAPAAPSPAGGYPAAPGEKYEPAAQSANEARMGAGAGTGATPFGPEVQAVLGGGGGLGSLPGNARGEGLLRQETLGDAQPSNADDGFGGEAEMGPIGGQFTELTDNPFELVNVPGKERSTFSIDVDTASYAKVRNFLNRNQLPPPQAVRIEELVNYFDYEYAGPPEGSEVPFNSHIEVAECPWRPSHRLVRVAVKGREVRRDSRPVSNLVFLLDVSGSMNQSNKLPLLKSGMQLLVNELTENDLVSIVVYAGAAGMVLPPTSGDQKETILQSLERLQAGGSTAGAQGIQLAYDTAIANYVEGGANRVILCTDGDFNVGVSDTDSLVRMAEQRAKSGVYLSVLAFGMDNHNDTMLEQISNKGNGNYAFIDTLSEARKVLVQQMSGTLLTIAKDVKLQVEFNPARVLSYRLIGYENRVMANVDFRNDAKDAGEIGAGHMVTALYEIVPVAANQEVQLSADAKSEDEVPLRYQSEGRLSEAAGGDELLTLFIRYKQPDSDTASELEFPVSDAGRRFGEASQDYRFAASVAGFGMLLRRSPHCGDLTWDAVREIAQAASSPDPYGYRTEFLQLVNKAKALGEQ